MEIFTIKYKPNLGSFLDEKKIKWESMKDTDHIKIYSNKGVDEFTLGMAFVAWLYHNGLYMENINL